MKMDSAVMQTRSIEVFRDSATVCESVRQFQTRNGVGYQIKMRVLPYLYGFVYLAPLDDCEWLLIDSGCGDDDAFADLESAFRAIREEFDSSFAPERIRCICLTHAHIDHFGGVHELKRRTNAEVAVHALESRLVERYDEVARVENCRYTYFLLESGVPSELVESVLDGFGFRPGRAKHTPVDRILYGGETIGPLQTVYLPGHSPGHLAYLCGDIIFSGDLLLSKTCSQIWPERMTPKTGVLTYVRSLLKLKQIALDYEKRNCKKLVALPSHEEPIFNIPERVDKALRLMERRNSRLLKIFDEAETPSTLWEISPRMYWSGRPHREFFALSDIASRVELFQQFNLLKIANPESLSYSNHAIRYSRSLSNAEAAKNTIKQVVSMQLTCDEPDLI
jgi:glyoxylase-like metal-dependent hydrolase (beta-lactamase superfamily II)